MEFNQIQKLEKVYHHSTITTTIPSSTNSLTLIPTITTTKYNYHTTD